MKSLFDFYVISEGLGRYFIIMEGIELLLERCGNDI